MRLLIVSLNLTFPGQNSEYIIVYINVLERKVMLDADEVDWGQKYASWSVILFCTHSPFPDALYLIKMNRYGCYLAHISAEYVLLVV